MSIIAGEHTTVDPDHEVYDAFYEQEIRIGKFSQIAPKVVFCGAINHHWVKYKKAVTIFSFDSQWKVPFFPELTISRGPIVIGNDAWVGRGAFILDGVTIGDGAIVGAMSVVAKDVPPYAVVVGNPARIVHYRYNEEQIKKLLEIKWWDWSNETIMERVEDFKDIDVFLKKYYKGGVGNG